MGFPILGDASWPALLLELAATEAPHEQRLKWSASKRIQPERDERLVARRLCEAAGVDRSHSALHCLRHTFGTNLLPGAVEFETLRDLMGHTNVATTAPYLSTTGPRRRTAVATLAKQDSVAPRS